MKSLVEKIIIFIISFGVGGCYHTSMDTPLEIKFNSNSYVLLEILNVQTPFDFRLEYYPNLAAKKLQSSKYIINTDTTIMLELVAHMPEKHELFIEKNKIPFFITLDDTVKISYDYIQHKTTYSGANQLINNYLFANDDIQQKITTYLRNLYHQYDMPYEDLYLKLDSIENIELSLLATTQISIPKWYRSLEQQNIKFKIAEFKLSSASYRNFLKQDKKNIPSKENLEFLNNLDLSSPFNQYLYNFYSFMNFYSFYLIYDINYVNSDSVSLLFNEDSLSAKMFESSIANGLPNYNFSAFAIHQTIGDIVRGKERKNGRIEYLKSFYEQESDALAYLLEVDSKIKKYNLKSGDQAPEFFLEDLNGNLHSIKDDIGKIILLNFYTKGCIACVKEVPFERELQNKYGNSLQIINVCLTNSKESFRKTIEKFQLEGVNVFTQGNWKKIIEKKYMITAYPHYTLIDKKGVIIKNNTYKPSSLKLDELIKLTLLE
ncbi:MAG: redoxin domain-containing protein [Cyclobacteriaceae bacterium]|nr:redoxin domain-containing protein [Cyclobacteriaceae bacterium]